MIGVKAKWVLPVGNETPLSVIEDGMVVFDRLSGRIVFVGPHASYPGFVEELLCLEGEQLLMPGLINMHSHSPMSLLRGYSEDLPLKQWLEQVWSAEHTFVDEDFVKVGTSLSIYEMIKTGTTTFCDNYFKSTTSLATARDAGVRIAGGEALITSHGDDHQKQVEQLHSIRSAHALFSAGHSDCTSFSILTPHSCYAVSEQMLLQIKCLSDTLNVRVNIHLHESTAEVTDYCDTKGETPIGTLERLGLLNEKLIAAHCVALTDDDIALLAKRRVNIVTCPRSNLKLASGVCRVAALVTAGVNVSIGTDGCCSNNSLDLLADMQLVSLLGKGVGHDASVLTCDEVLQMATINGAKALGVDAHLGSIEVGKLCDMISIDFNDLAAQPVIDVKSSVVHTSGKRVSNVWVGGRLLMKDGVVLSVDVDRAKLKKYRDLIVMHKSTKKSPRHYREMAALRKVPINTSEHTG